MHCSSWIQVLLVALTGCVPAVAEDAMDDENDVEEGDSSESGDVALDDPAVELRITSAFLESLEGETERTAIFVGVEVSNLGVAPITSMQLRAFTFADYWSRSSTFENPAGALPIAPGDTVELRFFHEEDGALFDCAEWDGPETTDVRVHFAVGNAIVDAGIRGRVGCRFAE